MHLRCPKCGTELRQLGIVEDRRWLPENFWNCQECKFPDDVKVYSVLGGRLVPASV